MAQAPRSICVTYKVTIAYSKCVMFTNMPKVETQNFRQIVYTFDL